MKQIKFSICTASLFMLMSCVDLNLNPLSEGSSENWYSSQAEIEMSLNDFYRTDFFPIDDMKWGDDVTARNETSAVNNGTLTSEDGTIAKRWENYYKGIARALRIINNMDRARAMGVSERDIAQYEGEAYFYLGYAYGMLAFHWGDAILDKVGMSLDEAYTASRSPKADVLAYSYECLDKAAERLPNSYPGIQRATKGAAYAFKARIAIYNEDYAAAATAAKNCMDLNVYKLHSNYQDLFTASWSDEWIFFFRGDVTLKKYYWAASDVLNSISRLSGGWGGQKAPSYELVCAYPCIDGKPIDESPLYNPKDFFENRDPRMAMTILENGKAGAPTTYPMLRYGDVLLMYAEAMNEMNQCSQEVLDATINKLRERAYNGTDLEYPRVTEGSQQQLRTVIRTERFIEMAWEGHRYSDLIRWKIAGKVFNRPIYFLNRAWSGNTSWNGDESSVSAEYKQLIQNWKDGNYPIGGIPQIDEDGIADLSGMAEKGYITVATERKFDESRDYLWPVPAADRLINENLSQNPKW